MKRLLGFTWIMQGMKEWNIRQPQLVRLQKIQNRVNMRFSGFRKDGMQDLLFAAIW